jgi:hypothetical protein
MLGGCVAGIASSAIGMAVRSARGEPVGNQHLQPAALEACSARATQHGAVHIIDVEQSSVSKIVVWGTVSAGSERQSFECTYKTSVTDFKLRAIK